MLLQVDALGRASCPKCSGPNNLLRVWRETTVPPSGLNIPLVWLPPRRPKVAKIYRCIRCAYEHHQIEPALPE
jgi:Zn ribbon nucleic-acid-binding protein